MDVFNIFNKASEKINSYFSFIENKINNQKTSIQDSLIQINSKIFIWISCALLYLCQTSPLIFSIDSNEKDKLNTYIGIILVIFGFLLEIEADNQKKNMKEINPNKIITSGLYKIVRCPNYLGEIILWTGSFIFGINIYSSKFKWFIAILGYVGIVYVMFSGCRRIEIRQNKEYKDDKEYKEYYKTTPIIIPFLPLYSVEKYWWLKG